jgi:hypothetical protein
LHRGRAEKSREEKRREEKRREEKRREEKRREEKRRERERERSCPCPRSFISSIYYCVLFAIVILTRIHPHSSQSGGKRFL